MKPVKKILMWFTTGARAVCVYGGTGISEQIAELKRGKNVVTKNYIYSPK